MKQDNLQPVDKLIEHSSTSRQASAVRVLVAVGINPYGERLLKTAARLSSCLEGRLLALHIAPPGNPTSLYAANIQRHLDLARSLGAEVATVPGNDIAAVLVKYAREQGVTHIVLGQSDVSRWREVTRGSVINRIQRLLLNTGVRIDLYIVSASSRF